MDCISVTRAPEFLEYIETHKKELTVNMLPSKGKGLVMLRLCNELLKRLSRCLHAELYGRVLTLLANIFPLAERSGVNMLGSFNSTVTMFEGKEDLTKIDRLKAKVEKTGFTYKELKSGNEDLFSLFWKLQDIYTNMPTWTETASLFGVFQKLFEGVIKLLGDIKSLEDSLPPHQRFKYARAKADELFFAKYLPNPQLFTLQLKDPFFRSQFLIQSLIILQYSYNAITKHIEKQVEDEAVINNLRTGSPLRAVDKFSIDKHLDWINTAVENCFTFLSNLPLQEPLQFAQTICDVISAEKRWIHWKQISCPATEKPPVNIDAYCNGDLPGLVPSVQDVPEYGSDKLQNIWTEGKECTGHYKSPSLREFLEPLKEQLDPSQMIEEEYRLSNNPTYVWKVLRLTFASTMRGLRWKTNTKLDDFIDELEEVEMSSDETLPAFQQLLLERQNERETSKPVCVEAATNTEPEEPPVTEMKDTEETTEPPAQDEQKEEGEEDAELLNKEVPPTESAMDDPVATEAEPEQKSQEVEVQQEAGELDKSEDAMEVDTKEVREEVNGTEQ